MSPTDITVTVTLDTDEKILADRVAEELEFKVNEMSLTLGGEESTTNHSVASVKVGKPTKS